MIYEVIVITIDDKGKPHCAPMGITYTENNVIIRPFKSSTSYHNLNHHRQCTINITDDVRLFAGALTGRACLSFLPCQHIDGYYLSEALAHTEATISEFNDEGERATCRGTIKMTVNHAPFQGFNRAQAAVIEASILVSRLHLLPAEKIQQEMCYLALAIAKTAGAREREAWGWLVDKITNAGIAIHE